MSYNTRLTARACLNAGAALPLAMMLAAQPALAQEAQAAADEVGLEEIVVTAQRRSENLQVVPISVTTISPA